MLFFSKPNSNSNIGQKGMTLIEVMVALSIFALVVAGALSLFASAQSTQSATTLKTDVNAIRSAVRNLYFAQGSYGSTGTNLNNVLQTAKKVPSTMAIPTSQTITSSVNAGTVNVTAQGGTFEISIAGVPAEICAGMITGVNGWVSVSVTGASGSATTLAQPVTVAAAQTNCSSATANILVFTSN